LALNTSGIDERKAKRWNLPSLFRQARSHDHVLVQSSSITRNWARNSKSRIPYCVPTTCWA